MMLSVVLLAEIRRLQNIRARLADEMDRKVVRLPALMVAYMVSNIVCWELVIEHVLFHPLPRCRVLPVCTLSGDYIRAPDLDTVASRMEPGRQR